MQLHSEAFIPTEHGRVRYRRTMPLLPNAWVTVEIILTDDWCKRTDGAVMSRYLDRAVAAILTRNGILDTEETKDASQGVPVRELSI